MAKDSKRQAGKTRGKSGQVETAPGWVWGLGGLAAGLAVAYAVHVYHLGDTAAVPAGAVTAQGRTPVSEMEDDEELWEESPFDFYEILPDFTVDVPEEPASESGAAAAVPTAPAVTSGSYWLQAGSFRRHEDADRRKAQLALLGFSSFIQRVAVDDQTWHRVRVGPYDDPAELSQARTSLAGHDIKTLRVKVQE